MLGDTNTSLPLLSSPSTHSMDSYLLYVAIGSSVLLGIRPLPLFVLFLLICFVCSATGGLFTVSLFLSLLFVLPFFVCFESLFASGFGAVGVAAVAVFLLIIVCFLAVEVSLLVLGFDEEDTGVAETFVAPVADLISTASVWQPTDTTCFTTTLANDGCLLIPSTIFRASGKEIFRSVRTRWISFSVIHLGQFLE